MNSPLPSHIWHLHGSDVPGPRVAVLGGTHGDELTGLWLVQHMLKVLGVVDRGPGSYIVEGVLGHLYIGIGNPEAVLRGTRSASRGDEKDLNRCFEPMVMNDPKNAFADVVRARELFPFLQGLDYLFDIHAVSNPKVAPFVCFGHMTPRHRQLCDLIPVRHILTDPNNILPTDDPKSEMLSTTDAVVDRSCGTAITYETGYQDDKTKLPLAKRVVVRLLREVGVVDARLARLFLKSVKRVSMSVPHQRTFALTHCLVAKSADGGFRHGNGMLKNWRPVCKGELYGTYSDGERVEIPENGFLVFPATPARIRPNKAMAFIASEISS